MPGGMLGRYLRSLREDHASGEAAVEVSGYGALQVLLNSAGERLSPRVRAVVNPRNRGAGTPDGGLFTSDQFRHDDHERGDWPAQLPARGAPSRSRGYRKTWRRSPPRSKSGVTSIGTVRCS